MKKIYLFVVLSVAMLSPAFAQVAISTDGFQPAASAMLDVTSTSKGMLVPRMTTAQRTRSAA